MRKNQPWMVLAALLTLTLGLLLYLGNTRGPWRVEELLATQVRKVQLTAQVRASLLSAVDAGKNALLADSPESSKAYADQARAASKAVDAGLVELKDISARDGFEAQRKVVENFAKAWGEVRAIDEEYLALVVQKTNEQASKLSQGQGLEILERLERALRAAVQSSSGSPGGEKLAVACFDAVAQASVILALQAPHIGEATDAGMDRIEERMQAASQAARKSLAEGSALASGEAAARMAEASRAFEDFEATNQAVLRLSRINSDVKSLALLMDRRRVAAAACESFLNELQELINARLSKASR